MTAQKTEPKKKQTTAKRKPSTGASRTKKETGLNFEQQAFVDELLSMERRVAWKAYQRVYRVANPKTCEAAASRLLSLVKVQKAIAAGEEARLKRVEYSQDQMFNRLFTMLTADVNEIIEHRRENCRHCHGKDFLYQWIDEDEHEKVCEEIDRGLEDGEMPNYPSDAGGFGFDSHAAPNPDCPKCGGDGWGRVHVHDTRYLSPGARLIYDGVKQTKEGIEAKVTDRLAVARLMMQHMGMLDPKLTLKGDSENPLVALFSQLARMVIKWERRSLPNGAYRLSGMQVLQNAAPAIAHGYSICSYDEQFHDDLTCIKERLELSAGVWVGMMMSVGGVTQVLALLME